MSGGGLLVSKLEVLERHWFNHNRDPFKNKGLFEHQLKELANVDEGILTQAVTILSGEDVFPKLKKLLQQCTALKPQDNLGSIECNSCGSMGLVLGVVWTFEGTHMDVLSYDQKVRPDGNYTTRIIGRCKCENGLAYQFVKTNIMGKLVAPDQYLIDGAYKNGWDVNFEATMAAQYFRKKAREMRGESLAKGPMSGTINKIIGDADV